MPLAPRHPCRAPGCKQLVREKYCQAHSALARPRGISTAARGYDGRWQRYSKSFLAAHPLCGDRDPDAYGQAATYSRCRREGRTELAAQTDHIVPVTGRSDPRFWDRRNHQALCAACGAAKSAAERQ